MGDCQKIEFDLSGKKAPNHAFRSSFARSFAFEYKRQSKSLDYAYFEAIPVNEEDEDNSPYSGPHSLTTDINTTQCNSNSQEKKTDLSLPVLGFHDSPFVRQAFPTRRHQHREVLKMWKEKQDALKLDKPEGSKDNAPQAITRGAENSEQETPKKMSNRKLQTPATVAEALDVSVLQSRVETLSWQLRQAEQSRQMYKEVMDQVAKFLKRAHISLDTMHNKMDCNVACRVPRSRSVHTVDASPVRHSQSSEFPRTKSIAQIEGSQTSSAFKDFTWRRARKVNNNADEITPAKLAEEAFRLLRIVQSLMNTNEPDLAQSLNCSLPGSQRSSLTTSDELSTSFHRRLNLGDVPKYPPPRNCSSFLHSASVEDRNSPDVSSIHSNSSKMTEGLDLENGCLTSGLEAGFAGNIASNPKDSTSCSNISISKRHYNGFSNHLTEANSTSYELMNQVKPQAHQLSEDESGFSSMNSFQDVGLPMVPSSKIEGSFQEVGLPVVEETEMIPKHRRWSSSPVQTRYSPQTVTFPSETFHVLWV